MMIRARWCWVTRLTAVTALLFAVAAGCMQTDVESDFSEEGTATHSLRFTLSKEMFQSLGVSEDELQQEFPLEATPPPGVTVEQIDTEEEFGFLMRTEPAEVDDLGAQLNQLFASEGEGPPVRSFSGSFTRDGNTYTLNLTFDADAFFAATEGSSGEEVPPGMLQQMITLTYTARLPGELREHNGTLLEDGRVRWTLPTSGTLRMTARSETPSAFSGTLLLLIGAAAVL